MQNPLINVSRRSFCFFRSSSSAKLLRYKSCSPQSFELGNLLLTAYVIKTLSQCGTKSLDPESIPLSEKLVLNVLRRASLDPSKKIHFFNWCSERKGYKHTAETYSEMFRVLSYFKSHSHLNAHVVGNLFSSMKRDGVLVDSATFKLLLDALIRSGQIDSALEVLDQMEALGASLDAYVYNSAVIALVRKSEPGLALSMFMKLLQTSCGNASNVPCEPIACNELLVYLRRAGMRDEFKKVFHRLREKKVALDTWGYNICIHSFGCWGDLETSLCLFKEMKESSGGSYGSPDLCTYNSLIQVLCLVGKVKDALIVWEELKCSGHEPDAYTYRILIQGCSKSYRIEDATKIFSEMKCNSFHPDTIVYNSLLDVFLKARKLIEACQLFERMIQDGVRATSWTYNILVDGLIKNGRAAAGYTLFCDLKKKGQFVDGVTYSIVILHLAGSAK